MSVEATAVDSAAIEVQGSGRSWRRAAITFALTTGAIALFVVAFALGYDRIHAGKVLPGVAVATVPVGGLDRVQAEAEVRAALPDPAVGVLTLRLGDSVATIPYAAIDRDFDMGQMLDQAMAIGRGGSIAEELQTLNHGAAVQPAIRWDTEELIALIGAAAARAEVAPLDATISRAGADYTVVLAQTGQTFDREALYAAAVAAVADPAQASSTVSSPSIAIPVQVTSADAQAAVDRIHAATIGSLTMAAGGQAMAIPADVLQGWVRLTGSTPDDWGVAIESAPIEQYVAEFKRVVDIPATNATYTFEGTRRAKVVPAANGQEIVADTAVAAIVDELEVRAGGSAPAIVNLSVVPVVPVFSTAQAEQLVTQVRRLGRWTTHFTVSTFNGDGQNIRRPAQLINRTVVEPGAQFDFIDIAGPFTRRNGYTDGAAIIHGATKADGVLGGGLCSASTTLFNAVARAGFQIDERHNHAFYIERYPIGLDATIWQNGRTRKSFQFTNDTDYPVLLRGMYSRGKVTFEVWGVPDGRTVDFSRPEVTHEKEAANFVEYTNELEPGRFEHTEFLADGFDSKVTRTVRNANGTIIHQETYFSDYIKVDGIYRVGRYPTDPRAGTRIPADEYVRPTAN